MKSINKELLKEELKTARNLIEAIEIVIEKEHLIPTLLEILALHINDSVQRHCVEE